MTTGAAAMTEVRRPTHLAVLAGLSAGAYAGCLALVAMLQSSADAALIADRAAIRAAADAIAADHDGLEAAVAEATRRYGRLADTYAALLPGIAGVDASVDALARTTAGVTDSTLSLPSHVTLPAMPAVQAATRVVRMAAPATQATTGASGR
jgi:hypothetical protein